MDEIKDLIPETKKQIIECGIHGKQSAFLTKSPMTGKWMGGKCSKCKAIADGTERAPQSVSLPLRFKDCSFDTYRVKAGNQAQGLALRVCRKYAQEFKGRLKVGGCLILHGTCGTGKTHLACAVASAVAFSGYQAKVSKVYDIIQRIKNTWSDRSVTEAEIIIQYTEPDLLVIDEIGVQYGSESEQLILFRILNARYEDLKPTIIVSNLAEDDLTEYLGERVIDRFKESDGVTVGFNWESYRGEKS